MRIAYFDCFSGASGDMILGALLDAGWPVDELRSGIGALGLGGVEISAEKVNKQGFSATVMHSNRSQGQRQRALEGVKNGTYQILVATDIAARGIDVDGIAHVINYDTPNQAED